MKAGSALEQLVAVIQEYFKDSPNTRIIPNAKLRNRSGVEREIDVFVQAKVQGVEIGIAFECKDYSNKVSVEKVDAFAQKCRELPHINKKVMVSSSGFTNGVKKEAQGQGIELYQLDAVPYEDIFSPYDIYFNILKLDNTCVYGIDVEAEINLVDDSIYSYAGDKAVDISNYVYDLLQAHLPQWASSIEKFLAEKQVRTYNMRFAVNTENKLYVIDVNGGKHSVRLLLIESDVILSTQLQPIKHQQVMTNIVRGENIVCTSEYEQNNFDNLVIIDGNAGVPYRAYLKDSEGKMRKTHLVPHYK